MIIVSYFDTLIPIRIPPQEISDESGAIAQAVQQSLSAGIDKSTTPTRYDIEMSGVRILSG